MFQALCGLAAACTVTGQPAHAVDSAIQSPPQLVEVQQRTVVEPRRRAAVRNPPDYADQDQDNGCETYNCVGPRTAFRLPDELPYADYEQQYRYPPEPGR